MRISCFPVNLSLPFLIARFLIAVLRGVSCTILCVCQKLTWGGWSIQTRGRPTDNYCETEYQVSSAVHRDSSSQTPHELVQACHPKFRQPRKPHALATRMSHIWYHADRHEQWKSCENMKRRDRDASMGEYFTPRTDDLYDLYDLYDLFLQFTI